MYLCKVTMSIKKMSVSLLAAMCYLSAVTCAEPQIIDSVGEYVMSTSDTLDDAQEKAKQEALRSAVEKAGVYVESYSKVNNMELSDDQVRIIAGNIIKIEEKNYTTNANGNTFLIRCKIKAVIDTDNIDLQRAMEMKKTQEQNIELTKTVADLQRESSILKEEYLNAKTESEKLRIKNDLLNAEKELGNLYKKDYQGENILDDLNAATAEFSNFGKLYPEMPDAEFSSQIEGILLSNGWKENVYVNGSKSFTKLLDERFTEEITYSPMFNENIVFFYTPEKVAADKVYKIAFSNFCDIAGSPKRLDLDGNESATWEKETQTGHVYKTHLFKHYDGKRYSIRISKSYSNRNGVKHYKHSREATLDNLSAVNGIWYDEQGNQILTIANGYINGCSVIEGYDFAGGRGQYGVYRIMENGGPRDITIQKMNAKMIKIDNEMILKDSSGASYFESVNGVYLGMNADELKIKLGNPDNVINNAVRQTWVYSNIGLNIQFENGRVIQIVMKNNGKWFLDRSRLNYRNSIADFCQAYHLNGVPVPLTYEERKRGYGGFGYYIAKGEFLWFDQYPDSITLSIYDN